MRAQVPGGVYLETWASLGVHGHFTSLDKSPLASWQDMAVECALKSVDLVGAASPSEVIYMNTPDHESAPAAGKLLPPDGHTTQDHCRVEALSERLGA